jgi:hypothetical protein
VSTSRGDPLRRTERLGATAALSPELRLPLGAFTWTAEIQTRSSSAVLVGHSRHDLEVPTSGPRGIRTSSRSQRMASLLPTSHALGWRTETRSTAACNGSAQQERVISALRTSLMSPSAMAPSAAAKTTSRREPRHLRANPSVPRAMALGIDTSRNSRPRVHTTPAEKSK